MSIKTDPQFWDCECIDYYVHKKSNWTYCPRCDTFESDGMPDARIGEIEDNLWVVTHDDYAVMVLHHVEQSVEEHDLKLALLLLNQLLDLNIIAEAHERIQELRRCLLPDVVKTMIDDLEGSDLCKEFYLPIIMNHIAAHQYALAVDVLEAIKNHDTYDLEEIIHG